RSERSQSFAISSEKGCQLNAWCRLATEKPSQRSKGPRAKREKPIVGWSSRCSAIDLVSRCVANARQGSFASFSPSNGISAHGAVERVSERGNCLFLGSLRSLVFLPSGHAGLAPAFFVVHRSLAPANSLFPPRQTAS